MRITLNQPIVARIFTGSCSKHSDCFGDTPFCYDGTCDYCTECHYCEDGIDGTCGKCGKGYPTNERGPCIPTKNPGTMS